MIYDKIENLKDYIKDSDFRLMNNFLSVVSEDMEEKTYEIDGDRIYAKVMSYGTKKPEDCKLEAHEKYIDIQCTITGAEGIDVYKRSELDVDIPYNHEDDVIFYHKEDRAYLGHTNNLKGYFTLLRTDEAHAPQEQVGEFRMVKKFVIKYDSHMV